jgi:hypothetical protein
MRKYRIVGCRGCSICIWRGQGSENGSVIIYLIQIAEGYLLDPAHDQRQLRSNVRCIQLCSEVRCHCKADRNDSGTVPNFASRGYLALEVCQNFEQDISRRKLFEAVAEEDGQFSEVSPRSTHTHTTLKKAVSHKPSPACINGPLSLRQQLHSSLPFFVQPLVRDKWVGDISDRVHSIRPPNTSRRSPVWAFIVKVRWP